MQYKTTLPRGNRFGKCAKESVAVQNARKASVSDFASLPIPLPQGVKIKM